MTFLAPALLKSMDLQCGQRVAKSPTGARIMILRPISPQRSRQKRRALGPASSNVGGDQVAGQPPRGSLRAPPPLVPAFSGRAPTALPDLLLAKPGVCAALAIFCSSVSSIPAA